MATVSSLREDQLAAIDAACSACQADARQHCDGEFFFDRGKLAASWHDDGFVLVPCDDDPRDPIRLRLDILDAMLVDDAAQVRRTLATVLRNLADAVEGGGA